MSNIAKFLLAGTTALLMACGQSVEELSDTHLTEQETGSPYIPSPLTVSAIGRIEAAPDIAVVTGLIEIEYKTHDGAYSQIADIVNQMQAIAETAETQMSYSDISAKDIWEKDCLDDNQKAQTRHNEILAALRHNKSVRYQIRSLKEQNERAAEQFDEIVSKRQSKIRKLRLNRDIPEFRRELFDLEEAQETFEDSYETGEKQRLERLKNLNESLKDIEPRIKQMSCSVVSVKAQLRFTARIHPAEKAPEFMNSFTQAGVTKVDLFGYDFSDYDVVYQKAAERAVKNARAKATLIAERSGTRLKKVRAFSVSQPTRFGRFGPQSKTVVTQPRYVNYVTIPPEYETVTETVVAQEASTELITLPAVYETVTETIVTKDASTELVTVPATYETVTETVVVQPQSVTYGTNGQQHTIPAVTKQVNRRVVKTPASTVERVIPAETMQIQKKIVKTPARVSERVIPAVTKMETRRVIKTPARTIEQTVPTVTEKQFENQQSNALRQSVLSGPQKVEVSAYLVFDYETALDDVRIRN